MKLTKFRTEFSGGFNKFITNAGNGKKELQFDLVDGKPVIKVDKNGCPITYNRYADIQKNKDTNNYKKLLESGCDIKLFSAEANDYVDTTQFGESGADVLTAQSKLSEQNIKVEDLKDLLQRIYNNQVKSQLEKEQAIKQNVDKKETKETEKKDNK